MSQNQVSSHILFSFFSFFSGSATGLNANFLLIFILNPNLLILWHLNLLFLFLYLVLFLLYPPLLP